MLRSGGRAFEKPLNHAPAPFQYFLDSTWLDWPFRAELWNEVANAKKCRGLILAVFTLGSPRLAACR